MKLVGDIHGHFYQFYNLTEVFIMFNKIKAWRSINSLRKSGVLTQKTFDKHIMNLASYKYHYELTEVACGDIIVNRIETFDKSTFVAKETIYVITK
jgi:hypothetical protein